MERKLFMGKTVVGLSLLLLLLMTGCGAELINQADSSFREGDYPKSSELYEIYLANHPDAFLARRKYGLTLLKGGHPEEAAVQFKRVFKDRPYDSLSLLYLGLVYLHLGDQQKVLSAWQQYGAIGRPLIAEEVESQSARIVAAAPNISNELVAEIEASIEYAIAAQQLRDAYNASRLGGCGNG